MNKVHISLQNHLCVTGHKPGPILATKTKNPVNLVPLKTGTSTKKTFASKSSTPTGEIIQERLGIDRHGRHGCEHNGCGKASKPWSQRCCEKALS